MGNKPRIRFKGFTEDWEQRKLGEIADITKLAGFEFTKYIVYSDKGNIIALRGLNIKDGDLNLEDVKYIDSSDFTKLKRSKLFRNDILFTYVGTIGEVARIQEADKYYLAPNVSRIRIKNRLLSEFLMYYMDRDLFYQKIIFPLIATSSQPALSMANIREFNITYPSDTNEQQKIALVFNRISHLITLHQCKLEKLKLTKKALLQKLFPKNGKHIPEIRFKGFTDAWEQRKLGNLYKRVNERNDGTLGRDKWISVAKMYFQDPDKVQSNNLDTRTYVMKKGDIAFEGHPNNEFKFGRFVLNDIGTGIISELFPIYRPITEYDLDFWKYAIQLERVMAPIFAKSITSSGNSSNKLDHNHFLNQELLVPNIDEQKKIGTLLSILSKNITLHQRKLERLQEVKKGLLQKMFV